MRRAAVADTFGMSSIVREAQVPSELEESRAVLSIVRAVGWLLALVGIFLVWREVEPLVLFQPADGVVLSSGIVESKLYLGKGRRRRHVAERIFYRYELGRERFISFQYRRTNLFGSRSRAIAVASRYARHDSVRVWYNPLNPADAVISRKPEWFLFAAIALLWGLWARMDYVTRSSRQYPAAPKLRSRQSSGL